MAVAAAIICNTAGCISSGSEQAAQSNPTTVATTPISAESEQFLTQGLAAYGKLQYDSAIALYDKALEADKGNYKALSAKGIALAMKGNGSNLNDVENGIFLIRSALEMNPQYVPIYYDLALALKSMVTAMKPSNGSKRLLIKNQIIHGAITASPRYMVTVAMSIRPYRIYGRLWNSIQNRSVKQLKRSLI